MGSGPLQSFYLCRVIEDLEDEAAGEFGYAGDFVGGAPALEAVGYVFYGAGVGVAGCAYLDGGGSGEHEFYGVFGADYASHAYDG